jgi:EGF domain
MFDPKLRITLHTVALLSVAALLLGCPEHGDDDADDDGADDDIADDDAADDDTGDDDTGGSSCDDLECGEDAHCEELEGEPTCVCDDGYDGDGQTCTDVDECEDGLDECDDNASCTNTVGSYDCECFPGFIGDGLECEEVAAVLDGLRWEMPCVPGWTGHSCNAQVDQPTEQAALGGTPGVTYDVTIRFRGVVEQHSYAGGTQEDYWYIGGYSNQTSYNIYSLHISDPDQIFFLNAGTSGIQQCWALDYTKTIQVNGGAQATLSADAQDGGLIVNQDETGTPIVIPDIPPFPDWYDGQFIQMDVESVTLSAR